MCGIAGVWEARTTGSIEDVVQKMISCIMHRGPDDSGIWVSTDDGIGLGQRRLAIQDLSPAGHQPMFSRSGRFVLVLNGEIYNHLELRKDLESAHGAINWRGHSDTETLLARSKPLGVQKALELSVGMFAIALWDRSAGRSRWRAIGLGEKPLYYGRLRGRLLVRLRAQDPQNGRARLASESIVRPSACSCDTTTSRAAFHLPGFIQACARHLCGVFVAHRDSEGHHTLERAQAATRGWKIHSPVRASCSRAGRVHDRACGYFAIDIGCAARSISLGWHRFIADRGADAGHR